MHRLLNSVSVVLLLVLSCLSGFSGEAPTLEKPFVIATYNINWGNADLAQVARTISEVRADVVALQETNAESERFLRQQFATQYPHMAFHPGHDAGHAAGGFAFLSKVPLEKLKFVDPKHGYFGTYFAEVKLHGKPLQLANVHLQPAIPKAGDGMLEMLKLAEKMEQIHALEIELIHEKLATNMPLIMLGDFNSTSSLCAPTFLKEKRFVDSFAAVNDKPDEQVTWHWNYHGTDWRFRLDYIFHTQEIKTQQSLIVKSNASDHYLVVSKLSWSPLLTPPTPEKKVPGKVSSGSP